MGATGFVQDKVVDRPAIHRQRFAKLEQIASKHLIQILQTQRRRLDNRAGKNVGRRIGGFDQTIYLVIGPRIKRWHHIILKSMRSGSLPINQSAPDCP